MYSEKPVHGFNTAAQDSYPEWRSRTSTGPERRSIRVVSNEVVVAW